MKLKKRHYVLTVILLIILSPIILIIAICLPLLFKRILKRELEKLEKELHKFSGIPDMSDKKFNSESGHAIEHKFKNLNEDKNDDGKWIN